MTESDAAPATDCTDDLTITLICGCEDNDCVKEVGWQEFLHVLDDDGVVPVHGSPLPLKFVFRGGSKAGRIDSKLRAVLSELARRGAVKRVAAGAFEGTGFLFNRCAIEQ